MNKKVLRFAGCALGALSLLAIPAISAAQGKARVTVKYPAKSVAGKKARARVTVHSRHHDEIIIAGSPNLKSSAALDVDVDDGSTIYGNIHQNKTPIDSVTKLLT